MPYCYITDYQQPPSSIAVGGALRPIFIFSTYPKFKPTNTQADHSSKTYHLPKIRQKNH